MYIEFERPDLLYLLLLLPAWGFLAWARTGRGVLFARGESAWSVQRGWLARSGILLGVPAFLRAVAIACVIVALAGPQTVGLVQEVGTEGRGIALAVDLSTSMLAQDASGESRLEVAREAAIRFAERREDDELTLVGFGGQAFTRIPPTTDANLIVAGVESLDVELVRNGTDISGAIITAMHRLVESDRSSKVVVLLTDGAHNAAGVLPLAAARAAAAMGVRIHSISMVATDGGVSASADGTPAEVETVLTAVSALTGGRYFHAANAAALDSIYLEIDRIEAPTRGILDQETRESQRVWFLASALLFITAVSGLHGSRWGVVP